MAGLGITSAAIGILAVRVSIPSSKTRPSFPTSCSSRTWRRSK
jgi:hypothetical protein